MSEKTERPISETGEFPGWLEEAVGLLRSSEEHDENCGIPHPADPDQSDRCTCGLASRTQRAEDLLAENFDRLLAAPDHPAPQLGERERYEPAQEVYDTAIAAFKRTREFSEEKANGAVSEETLIMVAIDNALPLIIAALANQEPQVQPDGERDDDFERLVELARKGEWNEVNVPHKLSAEVWAEAHLRERERTEHAEAAQQAQPDGGEREALRNAAVLSAAAASGQRVDRASWVAVNAELRAALADHQPSKEGEADRGGWEALEAAPALQRARAAEDYLDDARTPRPTTALSDQPSHKDTGGESDG